MGELIPQKYPTKSSHIGLQWLSLKHGTAPGTLVDALSRFATELLRKYEQVEGRTEVARMYGRTHARDDPWIGLEKVEVFLRQIRYNANIVRSLCENHHFVVATLPRKEGEPISIVGVAQFLEGPKKKLIGQFTCVSPDMQGKGIMEKMHRAIHGFGRKYGYRVYEADLSSAGSLKSYERMQRNPRKRYGKAMPKEGVMEKIEIKLPKKKNKVPSVRVKIFPALRQRRRK
ncbi:MAG: GNAT family N-acetyltransferase [Candidatus Iainarchaeum archaeon]|uniref:GNAT family N-acetyltransferase n=1 Tax=Candidatus Iainarchaeum sp. TaxID=3101447 RepID=A0A7T9DJ32_9ARCH|nr:MAG: GNAT family N-acetyltransferase [Candidatus Diapherotrites archaeon]